MSTQLAIKMTKWPKPEITGCKQFEKTNEIIKSLQTDLKWLSNGELQ
jgi:hypothetical protein